MKNQPNDEEPSALHQDIQNRFGLLPNFFQLSRKAPEIIERLWGFAQLGYLDNPLPSLFKERLFVYVSKFCQARYCIARHVGFLLGLGHPSGDPESKTQTVDEVVTLISRALPRGEAMQEHYQRLADLKWSNQTPPLPESDHEKSLFACATHVFLQNQEAVESLAALQAHFSPADLEYLLAFLTFVRSAHYWTQTHPELEFEADISELIDVNSELATCILSHPENDSAQVAQVLQSELSMLRREHQLLKEVERANAELREADRRKDQFLATLAHELRNPLAPICSGITLLKSQAHNPEFIAELSQTLEQQSNQLTRLINDLLDVSRITTGKITLRKERTNLIHSINCALVATQPLFQSTQHEFVFETSSQSIPLDGDPHRLTQIFSNLLNNAAKYTPPRGRITVSVETDGAFANIQVADDGIGIAPEDQPKIFELFTQIGNAQVDGHQGLGVGLHLVKKLVELHDGEVQIQSDGLGKGTTLSVRLPIAPQAPSETTLSATKTAPSLSKQGRVLIADDNPATAKLLALSIKLLGIETQVAGNGEETLELAATFLPHAIVMDIGMPLLNGYETAAAIRQQPWGKKTTLIALTGWGRDADRQKAIDAGFDHHLVKPAGVDEIAPLLQAIAFD
ncbi:ATP-binding protein [Pelagicoccus sp. SDUM812005]|uniref:ATP-binding protein n=1 Tax=Pelagicoccus sp. SDUM812005 TaxID=3041257 RepID=UPI00280FB8D6|nr:ATP-binding protein [Pelagicoccus sp. SDUM812005]MDQ8182726.1 ATP-binding protein [Pelagicoccus sp. SDUM812005]